MAAAPILDPEPIFRALATHGVRYVLIGGLAGVVHGSPVPTNDLDICPAGDEDNLRRLASALDELDARVFSPTDDSGIPWARDAVALKQAMTSNLITAHGRLDVSFAPSGTFGFGDLVRSAVTVEVFGNLIPVASIVDIIRSKEAAGREKDQRGVIALRKLLEQSEDERDPA